MSRCNVAERASGFGDGHVGVAAGERALQVLPRQPQIAQVECQLERLPRCGSDVGLAVDGVAFHRSARLRRCGQRRTGVDAPLPQLAGTRGVQSVDVHCRVENLPAHLLRCPGWLLAANQPGQPGHEGRGQAGAAASRIAAAHGGGADVLARRTHVHPGAVVGEDRLLVGVVSGSDRQHFWVGSWIEGSAAVVVARTPHQQRSDRCLTHSIAQHGGIGIAA